MKEHEIVDRWISIFGEGIDKNTLKKHVTSGNNYLWHLFSLLDVECLEGKAARDAFDKLKYTEAIKFYNGRNGNIFEFLI